MHVGMHVCSHMCGYMCMDEHMYVYTWRPELLNCFLRNWLGQARGWPKAHRFWLLQQANMSWNPLSVSPKCWDYRYPPCPPRSYVGSGYLNSDPHTCRISPLRHPLPAPHSTLSYWMLTMWQTPFWKLRIQIDKIFHILRVYVLCSKAHTHNI